MTDRDALTISSRAQMRREIEQQIQLFLRGGGTIEVLQNGLTQTRPVGAVWRDNWRDVGYVRSGGVLPG